jgi:hypothetical protein
MRQIQVISGSNEYLLEGDDGVLIGELIIKYEPKMFCEIAISKRESVMEYLSINVA